VRRRDARNIVSSLAKFVELCASARERMPRRGAAAYGVAYLALAEARSTLLYHPEGYPRGLLGRWHGAPGPVTLPLFSTTVPH